MTPEHWHQIQQILDAAAVAPKEQRNAVLAEACGGDETLRQEVEALLVFEDDVDEFIEEPLWNLKRPSGTEPGRRPTKDRIQHVGHYRIERPLGKGGMGEVFLAVREDDYEQRVALKLVSDGANQNDLLNRFYTERQILASLQHPNIARLLDGGALEDGRPYFVMEYVEGEPIDRYCRSRGLSLRERLRLFQQVCKAVHFAHKNLVVHRDLKASNILVTPEGEPQLLDFGIAKLLQTGSIVDAAATAPGIVPMTPANASPEQILDEPITTACDIYALGVLLYSLLVDRPPYRLEGCSFAEMVQVICLDEPPKPSAILLAEEPPNDAPHEQPAAHSPVEKRRLHRRLLGDLDAIVMKAMRKEPDQRYGSVAALEEDIESHLSGLPVMAQRGNWFYYANKFVRRNKLAIVALLLIVGFAITATVQWSRASTERTQAVQERGRAERNQAKAEKVTGFLVDLFESADPEATRGAEVSILEALERGKERMEEELLDEPEIRAEIWGTLGTVYQNLGLYSEALELKEKALESWREFNREDHVELADHINNLAILLRRTGNYGKAEEYYREALEIRERLGQGAREIALAKNNLANALMSQGKDQETEPLLLEALALSRDLGEANGREVALALYSLGALYLHRCDFPNAALYLQEALALRIQVLGLEHTKVALVRAALGQVFHGQGRLVEAREAFEEALEILRRVFDEDHPMVAQRERSFAAFLLDVGEHEEARKLAEHSLEILRDSKPEGNWVIADAESVLGHCLLVSGLHREAEGYLLQSYAVIQSVRGKNSYFTHKALERVILLYDTLGQAEQAAKYRKISQASECLTHSKNV